MEATITDLTRVRAIAEFEAAMSSTRELRYAAGVGGAFFGAASGYSLAMSVPHITVPTTLVMVSLSACVYGLATYGAATLATEMNAVARSAPKVVKPVEEPVKV
jgi:uncharacterized membrane protein